MKKNEKKVKANENEEHIKEMLEEQAKEYGCSVEEVKKILIAEWGVGADRGYSIFTNDEFSDDLKVIEKIDELGVYNDDLEAAMQAERDGIKLIPIEEIPKVYPYYCYRFVDTPKNRYLLGIV